MPPIANVQQLYQTALQTYQRGDTAQAKRQCKTLLKKYPKHAPTLHLQAAILLSEVASYEQTGKTHKIKQAHHDAIKLVRSAIKLEPQNANFLTTLGTLYRVSERFQEAEQAFRKAIKLNPNEAIALDGLGQVYWNLSGKDQAKKEVAERYFKKAIAANANLEMAYASLAALSLELDDLQQAVTYAEQALARHPGPHVFATLGQAYQRLDQNDKAEAYYQRAIQTFPQHLVCYVLYAELLQQRGDLQAALSKAQYANQLAPNNSSVLTLLAGIQEDCGDLSNAQIHYERSITFLPLPESYYRLAANFVKQNDIAAALQNLSKALILEKEQGLLATRVPCYFERFGDDWQQMQYAAEVLTQVLAQMSTQQQAWAHNVVRANILRFTAYNGGLTAGEHADAAAYSHYLLDMHYSSTYTPAEIYAAHCDFNTRFALPLASEQDFTHIDKTPHKRLRIGYLSQDFRNHSVAYFIEGIMASHNPNHIEVYCYYNNHREDAVSERFKEYCTGGWRHCFDWSDNKLFNTIQQDKIDILVDLMGHTGKNRILIFARKPTPIQMSYLGYSDTTGLTAIDYRLTDNWIEPAGTEQFSSETLLRMPQSYFCYRPTDITERVPVNPLPALQNGYITFGSFNAYPKVTDEHIQRWAAILQCTPNSRLLLKVRLSGDALRNFKALIIQRFSHLGIPRERLIIKDFTRSLEIALQIYHSVDICLDTYPYNGATTTCESLWMGCPVVSLYGQNHVSRMSLSILSALDLGHFAVSTTDAYIDTAIHLAQDLNALADLRSHLRDRMRVSSLMDNDNFTQNLEQHYRNIWQQWCETAQ